MRINNILKAGFLSGFLTLTSCNKKPNKFVPAKNVPTGLINKISYMKYDTHRIPKSPGYVFFGYDTLKITDDINNGMRNYLKNMNKIAAKNTPFISNSTVPKYIEPKVVIKSEKLFEKNNEIYMPVEYYGIRNKTFDN